jgi:hypothetical protein
MPASIGALPLLAPTLVRKPWEATWWVVNLAKLGKDFPPPTASAVQWKEFISRCAIWPCIILAVGIFLSIAVLGWPLCCPTPVRGGIRKRPSWRQTFIIAVVLLTFLITGIWVYLGTASEAFSLAKDEIMRAIKDAEDASKMAASLESVGETLSRGLASLPPACPAFIRSQAEFYVSPVTANALTFQKTVEVLKTQVDPLPSKIRQIEEQGETLAKVIGVALLVPLALIVGCCFVLLLAISGPAGGSCVRCCTRFSAPLLMVPTILIVAIAAAIQLEVAVAGSSFCIDVDNNAMTYVVQIAGQNSTIASLGQYYILGQGSNPLIEDLQNAVKKLTKVNTTVQQFGPRVKSFCPDWKDLPVVLGALNNAEVALKTGFRLLSPDNVYPYYETAVREDACRTVMISLGWFVLFQAIVGLILLPLLITWANAYLRAMHVWFLDAHPNLGLSPRSIRMKLGMSGEEGPIFVVAPLGKV